MKRDAGQMVGGVEGDTDEKRVDGPQGQYIDRWINTTDLFVVGELVSFSSFISYCSPFRHREHTRIHVQYVRDCDLDKGFCISNLQRLIPRSW